MTIPTPGRVPLAALLCATAVFAVGCTANETPESETEVSTPTAPMLTTVHPVTVIDDGSGPELCLGFVFQPVPPGCDGPRVGGWEWTGDYEETGGVRWGAYVVTGTYDADADVFTANEVVAAGELPAGTLAEASEPEPEPEQAPAADHPSEDELQAIYEHESAVRDDVLVWGVDPVAGEVTMQVDYDADGSLQATMDAEYGTGVVRVLSSLEPVR